MFNCKKLLYLVCLALVFIPLLFTSPAIAVVPVDNPDNPAEAREQRDAVREFNREERVRRQVDEERGSPAEHARRMAEDFAKGQIEAVLGGDLLESVTGTAAIKKVVTECTTGCHAPEVVQKLKGSLDRMGSSGQEQRDKEKLRKRIQQLQLLDETVVIIPAPAPAPQPRRLGGRNHTDV